ALPHIQEIKRHLIFNGRVDPLAQVAVVAIQFVALVAKVLDGFVVDKRIDGLAVGLAVQIVHAAPVHHTFFGDHQRKNNVSRNGTQRNNGKQEVVAPKQDDRHHADLKQGWQNIEDSEI